MSALNLGPSEQASPVKGILIALVVLAAVGAAVFLLNPRKTAELSVTRVQLYTGHATFSAAPGAVHVVGAGPNTEDALYVIATVRLTDKLRLPLFVDSMTATVTAADGTTQNATGISASDISRLEQSFPDVTPMLPSLVSAQTQVAPGGTAEGAVLLHFPSLTEAAWKTRKSAVLTINLAHQTAQTVTIP